MDKEPILIDPIKEAIESAIKNLNFANELSAKRANEQELLRENKEMFREIDALNLRIDMMEEHARQDDEEIFLLKAENARLKKEKEDLIGRISKYE